MADYIFQTGTTTKGNVITLIRSLMIAAGWQDISSSAAADFIVMQSNGETGDKNLIVQIRDSNTGGANPISSTNYTAASVRFIGSYTPGTPGSAGTTPRSGEAWRTMYIAPYSTSTIVPNAPCTYYYHCNKNRIIIALEYSGYYSGFIYLGIPDMQYAAEPASRGVLHAGYGPNTGQIPVTDTPGEQGSGAASYFLNIYTQVPPKSPNSAGKYVLTEAFVGDANIGFRFQLTGIYIVPTTGLVGGDTFAIGTKKYRVTYTDPSALSAFSFVIGNSIAYQIQ